MASEPDPASAPPRSSPATTGAPPASVPGTDVKSPSTPARSGRRDPDTMIPARSKRTGFESFLMRVVATIGIVAIGVVIAAIMVSQDVQGWIVGLAVSLVSVVLAGVLWSSRRL
jgi:hypothetical protein